MNRRILVVDDEPDMQVLMPQLFRGEIREKNYEFDFAFNGKDALERLEGDASFDLILLDINMPVMDGLTFLKKLYELEELLIATVIISAFGDMKNIRTGMNNGAFDFITKPIDINDLKVTIAKALDYINERKKTRRLRDEKVEEESQLKIAAEIQNCMINRCLPNMKEMNNVSIHGVAIQAKQIGGDFFDYFIIDRYRLGVLVADVSGHGVAAAIFMALSKFTIKNFALRGIAADICMENVNKELFESRYKRIFVTAFYGILDRRDGSFEYCNCGHLRPFRISPNGEVTQLESKKQIMLAADKGAEYKSSRITLEPGETLFIYTDGLSDAFGENEEQFGTERVMSTLQSIKDLPVEKITEKVLEAVRAFEKGDQCDDMTCLALRFLGAKVEEV